MLFFIQKLRFHTFSSASVDRRGRVCRSGPLCIWAVQLSCSSCLVFRYENWHGGSLSSNHYHHTLMMPEMSSKQSVGVVLLPPPPLCRLISAPIKESVRYFLLMKRYRFLSSPFNWPSDCIITMMVDIIIIHDGRSFIVVLVIIIMLKVDLLITDS